MIEEIETREEVILEKEEVIIEVMHHIQDQINQKITNQNQDQNQNQNLVLLRNKRANQK